MTDIVILKFFATAIEKELGIIFSEGNYFQLDTRLQNIAKQLNFDTVEKLYVQCQTHFSNSIKLLLFDLSTNNETSFFRDPPIFVAFEALVNEQLFQQKRKDLKIWCCASSTGQEVYSLSMILNEIKDKNELNFSVLATDYSDRVLEQAKAGRYTQLEVQRGLSATRLVKYFQKPNVINATENFQWEVKDYLKKGLEFKRQNLLETFVGLGTFQFIFCRNVLIYQNIENKKNIVSRLAKHLEQGGYMILGAGESMLGISEDFESVRIENSIVYKKK